MVQILIGAAAGLLITVAGLIGYRAGLRRGTVCGNEAYAEEAAQQQDALMKKYEAILDYDPYGERV